MKREVIAFHRDAQGDWAADLDCGHAQHTRHDPPFAERQWVLTESGRRSRIGAELNCVRCDRLESPPDLVETRRTRPFDAANTPPALQSRHSAKPGLWVRIEVTEGRLRCQYFEPLHTERIATPESPAAIPPGVPHRVEIAGPVRFQLVFLKPNRSPRAAGPPRRTARTEADGMERSAVCPLCGEPNQCLLAAGREEAGPCWCAGERFPADLLARTGTRSACVCRTCLDAHRAEASAGRGES